MYTNVKQPTPFIQVASREMTDVCIYVGAQFFQFSLAVDFIRNILSKFSFSSRERKHLHFVA